ncbi:Tryptophan--tRNA ligase [Dictyocoela muelleri]|nr:Tryptophan--tRNA ligase [Dictyocoela muelleri]
MAKDRKNDSNVHQNEKIDNQEIQEIDNKDKQEAENKDCKDDFNVNPWSVSLSYTDTYSKIIKKFGCQPISSELLNFMDSMKIPIHRFIRRGIVFAHRDFDKLLNYHFSGKKFYIYTGRGPSSSTLHLGHVIPFIFTKYLQNVFNAPLVIQITDDEKYLWKELTIEEAYYNAIENIKDIISIGFDPKKTFIFINSKYSKNFDHNTLKISKLISLHDAIKIFGFDQNSNLGQIHFPVKEIAPCFPDSFTFLKKGMMCLVPAAIDQDPFFRVARDISKKMDHHKPCSIYSTFLPDLRGVNTKMSASDPNSSIYLNDNRETVRHKLMKYAFSGGGETLEKHKMFGGNTEVDVAFQYLKYFLENDLELESLKARYENGSLSTKELKERCFEVIWEFMKSFQETRAKIGDELLNEFFSEDKKI